MDSVDAGMKEEVGTKEWASRRRRRKKKKKEEEEEDADDEELNECLAATLPRDDQTNATSLACDAEPDSVLDGRLGVVNYE